ncbi:MAG: hypothetical protein NTY07_20430, partial [Bacteroidia bacterium]|nr:hypothetical protein [Bacteroidia bacterium]
MPNIKYITLIIFFFLSIPLMAQEKNGFIPDFRVSQSTFVSSGNDLPFWMITNQNGIFTLHSSTYQLSRAGLSRGFERDTLKKWGYTYGTNMVYGYTSTSDFHPNEYWLGLRFHKLILKVGAQSDPILFGGLSSTNGNMYRSRNARPVPGVTLSTNGYIPFFFAKKWFSFRFLYEEGILKDKQFVIDAHLHHKNLHFRALLSPSLSFSIGLEHYVFWGGYSPKYGQLPEWNEYFRYIFGLAGGDSATLNDQNNSSGNQLGCYNLEIRKNWMGTSVTFYWNHPFEDRSGRELDNLRDGLWGVHLGINKRFAFITDVVYEYMYTLNQSGALLAKPVPTPEDPNKVTGRGQDDYFNHGTYALQDGMYPSGYTHYQRMMGTPLFVPIIGSDGISKGFESTRMWMHHLGISGMLGGGFFWKSLLTLSRNFGRYQQVYPDPLDEFSFLVECRYNGAKLPFEVKAGVA